MNTTQNGTTTGSGDARRRWVVAAGHSRSEWTTLFASAGAALACLVLLVATSPGLPMVWDEGISIERAEGVARWFVRLRHDGFAAFARAAVEQDWRYTVDIEGHPAFYGLVIAFGRWVSDGWLDPLSAARFGPMLFFSIAAGAMFYRLWQDAGPPAALGGLVALLTMPRLFAHAHFALYDGILTSCWILAWAAFAPALKSRRWTVLWGLALGMTMSSKFTGWLAPPVFVAWAVIYGDRSAVTKLLLGFGGALVTFFVLNPRLWHAPMAGMSTFFELNLNRADTYNIPTLFFGRRYDMHQPLPWYNTLVWTAITVPAGTLALGAVGLISSLRGWARNPAGVLLVGHWLVLMVVRALPPSPPHDAERLFLPSFAFLAALAGVGSGVVWQWAARRRCSRPVRSWLAVAGMFAALAGSASSLAWYAPQWLSYYNLLIGGLRGAERAGFEAAYYWDALDGEALDWLHEHTDRDEKIAFAAFPSNNLVLMERWGTLRRAWQPHPPGRTRWYVVQRRPPFWRAADRWLAEHGRPAYQKTIRDPASGWGPWRLDVPLLEVFPYEQYERAMRAER
ncbi:MAG: glycosyltransferase family 39 protein [Pirellulales bacterium]